MNYQLGLFHSDINSNSMFAHSIEQTFLYYSFHESILSIIKGTRDYNVANLIMTVILENFILDKSKEGYIEQKTCINLDIIYNKALDISYELVKYIHKYYNQNIYDFNDMYNKLNLYDKLKHCKKFINKILNSPTRPDITNYLSTSSYTYDYNNIKDTIKLFSTLVYLYNTVYANKNLKISHTNTNDVFISEFYMFFSHFMFAYSIDDIYKQSNNTNSENATNFILNNISRSLNHLERGMLDITKILVVSVIESGYAQDSKFIDIINIRQNEYFLLAQSITDRIQSYLSWIKDIPEFKNNHEIKSILDTLI